MNFILFVQVYASDGQCELFCFRAFEIVSHKRDVRQRMSQMIMYKASGKLYFNYENQKATDKW